MIPSNKITKFTGNGICCRCGKPIKTIIKWEVEKDGVKYINIIYYLRRSTDLYNVCYKHRYFNGPKYYFIPRLRLPRKLKKKYKALYKGWKYSRGIVFVQLINIENASRIWFKQHTITRYDIDGPNVIDKRIK